MITGFTAHCLRIEARADTAILVGAQQGSALRGALFHALRGRPGRPGFCLAPERKECHACAHLVGCPVSFLVSTVDENGRRGADVPRPYVIEPPLGHEGRYAPDDPLAFGVTMFARALALFPYVIVAARRLEDEGIGHQALPVGAARHIWRPGRFRIERILAANPLTGQSQVVLQRGADLVAVPSVAVTDDQVAERARKVAAMPRLTIDFRTPTRLTFDGGVLRRPVFRVLVHRLVERLSSLCEEYAGSPLSIPFGDLMDAAERVRLERDETRWVELGGYSTRQQAAKYLNGFVGRATFAGDFASLVPLLVWGEVTHVGKDAVKGCGLYQIQG